MDLYTGQSLKTLQQHMSSVSVQVHKYRSDMTLDLKEILPSNRFDIYLFCFLCLSSLHSSQRLEKVKQVLLGEIEDLEQDDMALRSMEEELTVSVLTCQVPCNKNNKKIYLYVNGLWLNQTICRLTGKSRPWPSIHTKRKGPRGENITDECHRFPSCHVNVITIPVYDYATICGSFWVVVTNRISQPFIAKMVQDLGNADYLFTL